MKEEYSYNFGGDIDFKIFSHAGIFYLNLNNKKIAKCEDIKVLKSYIDGFIKGNEEQGNKWFKKYMELKKEFSNLQEMKGGTL